MAEREIVLRLKAEVGQYAASMGTAAKATQGVSTAAQAASRATTNSLSGISKAAQSTNGSINALGAGAAVGLSKTSNSLSSVGKAATSANVAIGGLSSGGMKGLSSAVDNVTQKAPAFQRLSTSIRDNRSAWDELSSKAMIGGAAIVGGLGLAAKAAIDWESAWAGVKKTVDGTPEQMAELESGLRGLAKTLPATHEEIAGVAEAAGQLGIARKDILGFTKTAIALGESTNLSAEEAATSLAKFSNIMGTAAREGVAGYEKLGSTLVALGNDGASTEQDIMQMALRLAGAGKQIGATEADILAMSNALSSVGIEAELGGGAMSRAMLKMNSAVISGGDELKAFAGIAGMSAQDFATAWRNDPIAATNAFVGGLGRINESGGDASAALDSVGLSGTQNAQVLLRAAGSSDLMTKSLKLGASAWEANAALQKEAAQRYETDASRIQVSMNRVKDAGISFGATIAPALATGSEAVAGFADAIGGLPGPAKTAISGVAGVTGAALLLGGATVKAVGFAQDVGDAFSTISSRGPRAEAAIGGVGRSAKIAAGAFAILAAASAASEAIKGDQSLAVGPKELAKSSRDATDAVKVLNDALEQNAVRNNEADSTVRTLDDALKAAFDPSLIDRFGNVNASVWEKVTFGLADVTSKADEAQDVFGQMDDMLSQMFAKGDGDQASAMLDQYIKAANAAGVSTKDFMSKLPQTREAMAEVSGQSKKTGEGFAGITTEAEGAAEATADLSKEIEGLGATMLAQEASEDGYFATLSEVKKVLKENGATLSKTTEAGRENRAALRDLATSTQEWAAASVEAGGSAEEAQAILRKGRQSYIDTAVAMGMPKREAKALADELFRIPPEAKTEFKSVGAESAIGNAARFGLALGGIPPEKDVKVSEYGSSDSAGRVAILKSMIGAVPMVTNAKVTESGSTSAKARVLAFNDTIIGLDGKRVLVTEAGAKAATGRVFTMDAAILGVKGTKVKVTEVGSTEAGWRVVRFKGQIYEIPPTRTSNVGANVSGGAEVGALAGQLDRITDRSATVTVTRVTNFISRTFGGNADGGMHEKTAGGLVQSFADGGLLRHPVASIGSQQPQIRAAGGKGILWAEEGAGSWEGFVSGHPRKRPRSRAITEDIASRLGGRVEWYADGGVRQHANRTYVAPQPRVMVQASPSAGGPVHASFTDAQLRRLESAQERGAYRGAYAGTAQRNKDQLARTSTNPRGRVRS